MDTEQPRWPYTCYAHERNGPNDVEGDLSFEEVRWAQLQALVAGTPATLLASQFQQAVSQRQQQFQVSPLPCLSRLYGRRESGDMYKRKEKDCPVLERGGLEGD